MKPNKKPGKGTCCAVVVCIEGGIYGTEPHSVVVARHLKQARKYCKDLGCIQDSRKGREIWQNDNFTYTFDFVTFLPAREGE